ncbi:hypothetical protein LY632_14265 [Erythrobacter sp. SDW2]|uniref:hypothetical protein n=1 Tax=Erythrobacter sp. SDW2 TaxID=2907154 RepID=UPI001F2792D2|nr:hypothetical protein [Erythrobacter sp. SDW2]UIP06812.1 hypothetical protein LY632_14265 [Erythrobacter sp. SDW2]
MARHSMRLASCAMLALAVAACGDRPAGQKPGDVFAEPDREAGDMLCDLTGTYETKAECDRFAEQYGKLAAGIDAFEPNQKMTADMPAVVRYSIVRLDAKVQGEAGEIAKPVAPPPPPPPAPVPSSTPATPLPEPPTSSLSPTLSPQPSATFRPRPTEVIVGERPIVIGRSQVKTAPNAEEAVAAEIIIPESWENTSQAIERDGPISDASPIAEATPEPLPTPIATGPTQEEIDSAIAKAESKAARNIGAPTGGTTETGQVKIGTIMYACLEADPSFKVEPADCQPKNTREDPDPTWRWTVTPSEPGTSQLKLRSGIVVEASDGGLRKIGQPSRTANIEVDVTTLGAVKRFFASAEEWLKSPIGALGALAALLLAIGGVRRAWKKMKSDEEPPNEPAAEPEGDKPPG